MTLLLMILGAAVASVLVAILIVKYLPLNLRWIASVLLLILAIFLGYKIYQGIMEPIQFAKEKVERYKPVIQKLKIIRDAQMKVEGLVWTDVIVLSEPLVDDDLSQLCRVEPFGVEHLAAQSSVKAFVVSVLPG